MYRVIIKNHNGGEVREFEYASKGKYVTDISIVENRIDLTCVQLTGDGSYAEALPEPITYTSEKKTNLLVWKTVYDDVKRNETVLNYRGTLKSAKMNGIWHMPLTDRRKALILYLRVYSGLMKIWVPYGKEAFVSGAGEPDRRE